MNFLAHWALAGPTFRHDFPFMRQQNWLGCCSTKEGILLTLDRVSTGSKALHSLADCFEDFEAHYSDFESILLRFYPELQAHA